jgi:hypothetical protein
VLPDAFLATATAEVRVGVTPDGQAALANCLLCGFVNLLPLSAALQKQARAAAAADAPPPAASAASAAAAGRGGGGAPASLSLDAARLHGCWDGHACASCGAPLDRSASGCGAAAGFAQAARLRDRLVHYDADAVER